MWTTSFPWCPHSTALAVPRNENFGFDNVDRMAESVRAGELRVWVTCVWCGDIAVDGSAVELRYDAGNGAFSIAFHCPRCDAHDTLDVERADQIGALLAAGMHPEVHHGAIDPFVAALEEPGRLEAEVSKLRDAG